MIELVYSYKGYEYRPEERRDDYELVRRIHYVHKDKYSCIVGVMPVWSLSYPSREYFETWIDAGLPKGGRPTLEELKDMIFNNLFETFCTELEETK